MLCTECSRQTFNALYEVGQVLGGGGFGTVYCGKRRYDELPVKISVFLLYLQYAW